MLKHRNKKGLNRTLNGTQKIALAKVRIERCVQVANLAASVTAENAFVYI